jgi:hypothetical protein
VASCRRGARRAARWSSAFGEAGADAADVLELAVLVGDGEDE